MAGCFVKGGSGCSVHRPVTMDDDREEDEL